MFYSFFLSLQLFFVCWPLLSTRFIRLLLLHSILRLLLLVTVIVRSALRTVRLLKISYQSYQYSLQYLHQYYVNFIVNILHKYPQSIFHSILSFPNLYHPIIPMIYEMFFVSLSLSTSLFFLHSIYFSMFVKQIIQTLNIYYFVIVAEYYFTSLIYYKMYLFN